MNRQKFISFCSAMTVLFFSANGLAKSNDFSVKPTVPSSKIKKTVPPSAPTPAPAPVSVQPSKPTKAVPASVGSTPTPKPAVPVATPKLTVPKPAAVNLKPTTVPASLPSSVGRTGLPQARVPADFGKSVQIPGSLRGVGQTNSIGERLPAGRSTPVAGFGKTSGAAAFGKGIGQRQGVGSVREEFSDLTGPVLRIGAGEQRQGSDTGESPYLGDGDDGGGSEHSKSDNPGQEDTYTDEEWAELFTREHIEGENSGVTEDDPDGKGAEHAPEDINPEYIKTADDGSGDGSGGTVDPNRMKDVFAGAPGGSIRFAPGEGEDGGGSVDPGRISEIQSQKNQVHTFEGAVPDSLNFEDLDKQAQETIKAGGVPVRSD